MVKFSVVSAALAMGLMVSPESLVRLGNSLGASGLTFLVALVAAAVLQMTFATRFGRAPAAVPPRIGEIEIIETSLGRWPAVLLATCPRVVTAVCLSTAVLATAGFVFNEVFLHWFPNFAFAFIILVVLVLINLLSPGITKGLQVLFVALSLGGLVVLSLAQFTEGSLTSVIGQTDSGSPDWRHSFLAVLLFIGFDLAGFAPKGKLDSPGVLTASMIVGIGIAALVLCAWGLASSAVVPPAKLRESTIPHMVAARRILGEEGRWIMGSAVVAGACASVNVLLMAGARLIGAMSERELLPGSSGSAQDRMRDAVSVVLIGAAIALMLATGMAGDPRLEVYVRAGLLFWLLYYAGFHYSLLAAEKAVSKGLHRGLGSPVTSILSTSALLLYVSSFLVLAWTDPERTTLLGFMSTAIGIVAVWYGAARLVSKAKSNMNRGCPTRPSD